MLNNANTEPTEWDSLEQDVPFKGGWVRDEATVDTEVQQPEEGLHHPKAEQLDALQESL